MEMDESDSPSYDDESDTTYAQMKKSERIYWLKKKLLNELLRKSDLVVE